MEAGLVHKKLFALVKTRFDSVFPRSYWLLKYQEAIDVKCKNSDTPVPWKCGSTFFGWPIAVKVQKTLIWLLKPYHKSDKIKKWLVSDTRDEIMSISVDLYQMNRTIERSLEGPFEDEVRSFLFYQLIAVDAQIVSHLLQVFGLMN